MAKRESIKRAVERKTADFQRLFIDDLNMVKKQFDLLKRVPPADPVLPRYAGQATTALVLAKRVDNTWQALQVCQPSYHAQLRPWPWGVHAKTALSMLHLMYCYMPAQVKLHADFNHMCIYLQGADKGSWQLISRDMLILTICACYPVYCAHKLVSQLHAV